MDTQATLLGAPVSQIHGPEKVTGRTRFAADVDLPGMLWGKILRSPYPHAHIRRIDASAAWSVPGVKAVVTGQDIPGHLMGKVLRDMPVLCWDRVRYIGDRVAAVAAETPEAAEEALLHIDVDYDVLSAVFDPVEAMRPDAPLLHDDVASYVGAPLNVLAKDVHNGQTRLTWAKGDVVEGFRQADVVLEHSFSVPSRHQGYPCPVHWRLRTRARTCSAVPDRARCRRTGRTRRATTSVACWTWEVGTRRRNDSPRSRPRGA
jgi:carbon-monoxide dehydrogenase large subunit